MMNSLSIRSVIAFTIIQSIIRHAYIVLHTYWSNDIVECGYGGRFRGYKKFHFFFKPKHILWMRFRTPWCPSGPYFVFLKTFICDEFVSSRQIPKLLYLQHIWCGLMNTTENGRLRMFSVFENPLHVRQILDARLNIFMLFNTHRWGNKPGWFGFGYQICFFGLNEHLWVCHWCSNSG